MQLTIYLQQRKAGVVASNWRVQTKDHFVGQAM
jgi:hypothetical protein